MLIKLFILVLAMVTAVAATQAMPDCPSSCGDLKIPYPFGTSNNCIIDEAFLITCNHTFDPPTPFLRKGDLPVLNISLEEGQLRINPRVYYKCYHSDGETSNYLSKLKLKNFTISSTKNKFTAIGCDTRAVIRNDRFFTGCFSFCYNFTDVVNRSCSGIGCCQTTIPSNVTNYRVELESYYNYSYVSDFNECGYAFIVEDDSFNFTSMDLKNLRNQRRLPMVLDWSIGSQTCDQAKEDPITYACKGNSYCTNSQSGVGYLCHCLPGFEGNPYLNLGCADVDECKTPRNHRCTKTCHNTFGAYNCSCPIGYNGDGWSNGTGCNVIPPHQSKFSIASVVVGITISLLAALLGISWLQMGLRQRKLQKLRQKFFDENGGSLLKQELAKCEGISGETIAQIYTAEDLKKATENYHESRILGRGGQGTVYKGLLTGKGVVAIKRSRIGDRNQVEEFVNEVIVVSQINHRNVVKLLGCCLETEVPLLVYEFVPNSTLFHHIHNAACSQLLRWETRLKIAIEAAGALSYLHFSASTPIVHRDIKSMNILLDHNYTAKIADFGSSRFIPLDKTDLTTLVQGTLGYLDPEYMHSNQLTDKSDVYSFGVVLIELLTGEKAFSFQKLEQERNLAMSFVSAMKEDQFLDVVDHRLLNRSDIDQIKEVAMLARECVRVKGEERPTMKEVANKLEGLRARGDHSSSAVGDSRTTKIESLHNFDGEGSSIIGYDSLKYMEIEGGR